MTNAQVQVVDFEFNGVRYTNTRPNYYYKKVDGKQVRIPKAEYDEAWEQSGNAEREAREAEQAKKDIEAEKELNKTKKQSKPRRSKDVAYEMVELDGEINKSVVTLTAKQVDFIKHIPDTNFYENGLDSTPWCDCLAEEIGGQFAGKPMTVGAMISTLKEKDLIFVSKARVNGKAAKYFGFTDLGKQVASELGLN